MYAIPRGALKHSNINRVYRGEQLVSIVEEEDTVELMQLLSNDISIDILRSLYGKKWCIASDVSSNLGIHTTTAQKYLSKMYDLGLLHRRTRECKTRSTYEYLLDSPKIWIEIDFNGLFQNKSALPNSVYRFYFSVFFEVVEGARKISGSLIESIVEKNIRGLKAKNKSEALLFLKCLEKYNNVEHAMKYFQSESKKAGTNPSEIRGTFFDLMSGILHTLETQIGKNAVKKMVEISANNIIRNNATLIEKYDLLEDLPKKYFGSLGGT